jgi:pimeloyl-ACP methyl ester carboxylesterase
VAACCPALHAQQTVRLAAADKHPLVGSFHPSRQETVRGGLLLLHMYRTSRISYEPLGARLAAQGFHVLALDMRGHGDSADGPDGKPVSISRDATRDKNENPFLKMHMDAKAGLDFLKAKGAPADRLGIVGASVGCSIALHTAVLHPEHVAAVVLMTPGTSYLGVPSTEHAPLFGKRPALILSSEEEAAEGARPLKALMADSNVKLILYPQKRIHGTHMFGKVPGVEAEIIHWLEKVLVARRELSLPFDRRVLVDGEFGADEAPHAMRIPIELSKGRKGTIRVCHSGRKIYVGFDLNERCMRQNSVEVYLNADGKGPSLPDESCIRISYAPGDSSRETLIVSRGEKGTWKETTTKGVMAQSVIHGRTGWSAEMAISLKTALALNGSGRMRMAFVVSGSVASEIRFHPAVKNIRSAPRTWLPVILAPRSR